MNRIDRSMIFMLFLAVMADLDKRPGISVLETELGLMFYVVGHFQDGKREGEK